MGLGRKGGKPALGSLPGCSSPRLGLQQLLECRPRLKGYSHLRFD